MPQALKILKVSSINKGVIAISKKKKKKKKKKKRKEKKSTFLRHPVLVDSYTVICWTSLFVTLGVCWGYLVAFILFLMENPVRKLCRP